MISLALLYCHLSWDIKGYGAQLFDPKIERQYAPKMLPDGILGVDLPRIGTGCRFVPIWAHANMDKAKARTSQCQH